MSDVMTEIGGRVGLITLNRARALNALSLGMIRDLTATLLRWRDDPQVLAVAVRGMGRDGPFGVFCAGETSGSFTAPRCPATLSWRISSPRSTRSTT